MVDTEISFSFDDALVEGYLAGFMMGYSHGDNCEPCERDDCPKGE